MRCNTLLVLAACTGWLAGCRSHEPLLIENYAQAKELLAKYERRHQSPCDGRPLIGPPAAAPIHRHRANLTGEALVVGHINLLLENGKTISQPGAIVSMGIGSKFVTTDVAGDYSVALAPGRYELRAGGVGFLWSLAGPLQVEEGDSIRLNFKLMDEVRPICD